MRCNASASRDVPLVLWVQMLANDMCCMNLTSLANRNTISNLHSHSPHKDRRAPPCLGLLFITCTATALNNHLNNIAGLFVDVSTVNNTHTTTSRTVAFGVFPARRARFSPFMFKAQLSFLTELLSLFHTLPMSGEPMCLRICLAVL